jgi:antitoxin component YwqK of YwqJK toxin-antitoxin module
MKIQLFVIFSLFIGQLFAQENCTFSYYNKKGGHYLFSTFYSDYAGTPLEGVCQQLDQKGKIYERRVFVVGRMKEEVLYYYEGPLRSEFRITQMPGDSVIGFQKTYTEAGKLQTHSIFYLNKKKRRCEFYREYYVNGNLRFQRTYCWAKLEDINSTTAQKDYPPHTIDEDGYTYLKVEFGESLSYYENGKVSESKLYRLEFSEYYYNYAMDGPYFQYFDNGKVMTKGHYHEGTKDGPWKKYYYTGELAETEFYKENLPVGTWEGFYPNGDKKYEKVYDPNSNHVFVPSETCWNEQKVKTQEKLLDSVGSGMYRKWSDTGVLLEETEWIQNSDIRGLKKKWYANGQVQSILDNRPDATSPYMEYYENGVLAKLHVRQKNVDFLTDTRQEWSETGQLTSRIISTLGPAKNDFSLATFTPKGQKIKVIQQVNAERKEIDYAPNGVAVKEVNSIKGNITGAYILRDTSGNIIHSFHYKDNVRHGICESFINGKVVFRQRYIMGCTDNRYTERVNTSNKAVNWTTEQGATYRKIIYTQLNKQSFNPNIPAYYSKETVDSLVERIIWFEKNWKSSAPLELNGSGATGDKIEFNLPVNIFKGADRCDTVNPYVKQLVVIFKKLNWEWPTAMKTSNDTYSFTYDDGNFYPYSSYSHFFQWYMQQGWVNVEMPERQEVIDFNKITYRNHFSITRYNACAFVVSYSLYDAGFQWLIYDDGSVEFLGQKQDWSDVDKAASNPNGIHYLPYD